MSVTERNQQIVIERVLANAAMLADLEGRGGDPKELLPLIDRHVRGDWGDVDEHDWLANEQALIHGSRLLSSYELRGMSVWIISDAAYTEDPCRREVTTLLRPEDY